MQPKEKVTNDPWVPLDLDGKDPSSSQPSGLNGSIASNLEPTFLATLPVDPLRQMIDSDTYIQSLERKLEKLKKARTKKNEPTSKDIITSLALFHDDQMRRFMSSSAPPDVQASGASDKDIPSVSSLQRRLHPEKQPLSAEEIIELVNDDVVGKAFEELHISDDSPSDSSTTENTKRLSSMANDSGKSSSSAQKESDLIPQGSCLDSVETDSTKKCELDSNQEQWANFDNMNEDC